MDDKLIVDSADFLKSINVNIFKLQEWNDILNAEEFSIGKYSELVNYFVLDSTKNQNGWASQSGNVSVVAHLEKELYEYLSSEKERAKAELLTTSAIGGISSYVAEKLGLDVFIVTGFANLIILGIIKIGINGWCKYYKDKLNVNSY